jgi:histone-lysine N-methyltransferase SETMAR
MNSTIFWDITPCSTLKVNRRFGGTSPPSSGSNKSSRLIVFFFDVKGIVHREFVHPNTTVNSDFCYDVLRRLRENVRRKRSELWRNYNWLLHHDNAPADTSLKTTEFVTNSMVMVPHPPYSPDLAPCDFALFPKLKMKLKGRRFETVSWHPKGIASGAFEAWEKLWDRFIMFPRRLFWRRWQPKLS